MSRRALLVWGVGLLAYTVAVFDRTSLAVAGVVAQDRFDAGPAALSLFAVLQLAVYASMQVPVGLLVDRIGSRAMVAIGAVVMGSGQLVLAFAESTPTAVAARVLVGLGDAMTFISVLRLVPMWFPSRQVPLLTQLTGMIGQLGQVASAVPLVGLLHGGDGWATAYGGAAALSVVVVVLVLACLRDAPAGVAPTRTRGWADVRAELRNAWREPGTRLGLWTHFVTPLSGIAFGLLWGYPFLVQGHGVAPATAGVLLSTTVIVSTVIGPVFGALTGRWPLRRSALVFFIVGSTAVAWTAVLAWPGPAPLALLGVLVVVLGTNGPGSLIGFDYARTANPATRLGSANGIVNVGGFFAGLVLILAIGGVLQLLADGSDYTLRDFRVAFATQYVLWVIGIVGVVVTRRQVRRRMAEDGVYVDPLYRAIRRVARRRTRDRSRDRAAD